MISENTYWTGFSNAGISNNCFDLWHRTSLACPCSMVATQRGRIEIFCPPQRVLHRHREGAPRLVAPSAPADLHPLRDSRNSNRARLRLQKLSTHFENLRLQHAKPRCQIRIWVASAATETMRGGTLIRCSGGRTSTVWQNVEEEEGEANRSSACQCCSFQAFCRQLQLKSRFIWAIPSYSNKYYL